MRVKLAQGGGGRETAALISELILSRFSNPILDRLEDAAILETGQPVAFTTDSFVVKPLEFPGGDIGKLCVCGTLNDLSVMAAVPKYLSLALIIEEGLEMALLERVLASAAREAAAQNIRVVCGDTKVVEKGGADGLFINTSGLGLLRSGARPSASGLKPGDALIFSGFSGDHAIAVLGARKELNFSTSIVSDCACLEPLVAALFASGCQIHSMRDVTRGGLSAVANELGEASKATLVIEREAVPVRPETQAACDLLGFNPLDLANEGKILIGVPDGDAPKALKALRAHPLGRDAAVIGRIEPRGSFPALLQTALGNRIILEMPRGELLPRIC